MLLLIDIGNTNIVVGCYENEKITQEARLATDALKTSDQYCMDLKNLLSLYEIERASVTGVIISSVVPPVLNSVRTAVMKLTGKKPLVVGPGIKTGLNILLDNPASVGSDLVVGAVSLVVLVDHAWVIVSVPFINEEVDEPDIHKLISSLLSADW